MTDNEGRELITLEFDDGGSLECEIVCTFLVDEYPDAAYAAICPLDESLDDVYVFKIKQLPDNECELIDIEDDAEWDAACRELDQMIEEASEE